MKTVENKPLSAYTTLRMGGCAKRIVTPESVDELIQVINDEHPGFFIGGGSNLLIAERTFDLVVDLRAFNPEIRALGDGRYYVGASVRLQNLINQINRDGCGGIEYLFSVPGLVGGAVVMNAGRGKAYNQCISDHIDSVDVIRDGRLVTLSREECGFSYRNSAFKGSADIVVGIAMHFDAVPKEQTDALKKQRIELCKEKQDMSKPNFGSVYSESDRRIMEFVRRIKLGGRVHFSGKTPNWLLNDNGTFDEAMKTMRKVEFLHKLLHKRIRREVIVWE